MRKQLFGIYQSGKNSLWGKPLTSQDASVGTRRLRASWTPELAQDLQAIGISSAHEELMRLFQEEMLKEVRNPELRGQQIHNQIVEENKLYDTYGSGVTDFINQQIIQQMRLIESQENRWDVE